MALKRINKELNDILSKSPSNYNLEPVSSENKFNLISAIKGPIGTPYEGGIFYLSIKLTDNYPFKPPKVHIITKIYHPNVNPLGLVSLSILCEDWFPNKTISNVITTILQLLEKPDIDNPYDTDIALIYKNNYKLFEENAKICTQKFAKKYTL